MYHKWGGVVKRIYPYSSLISIKRFKKGVINQTYDIKLNSKSLVLRIYPKDFWKVRKEEYLYNLIREKTYVPVPEVLAAGKNYILLSKIEGKELPTNNASLVEKAGELLAKLHSIKFPYFGWIIKDQINPKFTNWIDFINYDLNLKFKKIPKQYSKLKKQIKGIVNESKSLLQIDSEPCLLHKDYHSSHILVSENKINGIIDLEWAMAGHNEFDLAKSCVWMFENKPGLEKVFLQGYKKYGAISEEFSQRKKVYSIITLLSSLSFSYECKHKKWCIYNFDKLKGELDEYHKNN